MKCYNCGKEFELKLPEYCPVPTKYCCSDCDVELEANAAKEFKKGKEEFEKKKAAGLLKPPVIKVLSVARIYESKGFTELVKAMGTVKSDCTLSLCGRVEDEEYFFGLKKLAVKEGVCLSYVGLVPLERMHEIYPEYDIFCMLSHHESFGIVFLEAMACGLPVVTTNVGVVPELIENGVNGFVVGDCECNRVLPIPIEEVAEKIDYLVSHKKKRLKMGCAARRTIEKDYSQEAFSKNWLKVIEG